MDRVFQRAVIGNTASSQCSSHCPRLMSAVGGGPRVSAGVAGAFQLTHGVAQVGFGLALEVSALGRAVGVSTDRHAGVPASIGPSVDR